MRNLIIKFMAALATGDEANIQQAKARLQRYLDKHMMAACMMTAAEVALCKENGINF